MGKNSSKLLIMLAVMISSHALLSQNKTIALKDIWASRTFSSENVYGMNPLSDGKSYAILDDDALNMYNFSSGALVKSLVSFDDLVPEGETKPLQIYSYTLSDDEQKMLIPTENEAIYRHSSKSFYYIFDLSSRKLKPLSTNGKQQLATFSPDGKKIAFARDNNLYIKDLDLEKEIQITTDGKWNEIINGTTDWVYEEEFSFTQAFFWSHDSKKLAFIRFDESKVKEFQMTIFEDLYPENYSYKYPKAGESNSIVDVIVYNLDTQSQKKMDIGNETDIYIPRIQWTRSSNLLSIQRLNRHQNHFEILLANVENGETRLLYEEKSPYYIDITDDLYFLPDGKSFLISSEQDGYNHIYHYDFAGKKIAQLTGGNWDVTKIYGYSPKEKLIYYQSAAVSPLERNIYFVDLKGKITPLVETSGHNNVLFSTDYSYFINTNSTINTPNFITVHNKTGKTLRNLKDNKALKDKMLAYEVPLFEFFSFTDSDIVLPDGQPVALNAWKLLPPNFDPAKKYPVLIYIYGGPGSQTVNNSWGGANHLWFQHLAQKGIIVISVDNRGTGARGSVFKKMTYKELGKYETEDLITTAKYLSRLSYVDSSRIGVFGWSYGGYMSSLAITKGAEQFKAAIAVAPVTNWRYYDNIYTERYMQLPSENADGYDLNSPINHVDKLVGNYLLVHGSGDDNVHYQNSMEMINALVKANKQFELMIYPNRNHGIYGGNTRLHLYEKMGAFLENHLLYNPDK